MNEDGEYWADRASFEVLDARTAMLDLTAASVAGVNGLWRMVHVYEGDIERPEFVQGEDFDKKEGYDHG